MEDLEENLSKLFSKKCSGKEYSEREERYHETQKQSVSIPKSFFVRLKSKDEWSQCGFIKMYANELLRKSIKDSISTLEGDAFYHLSAFQKDRDFNFYAWGFFDEELLLLWSPCPALLGVEYLLDLEVVGFHLVEEVLFSKIATIDREKITFNNQMI